MPAPATKPILPPPINRAEQSPLSGGRGHSHQPCPRGGAFVLRVSALGGAARRASRADGCKRLTLPADAVTIDAGRAVPLDQDAGAVPMTDIATQSLVRYGCEDRDRDLDLEPAGKAQRVQRRSGAPSGRRAAPFRSRPRGRSRDHLRRWPRLFERRRRASAPAAPARGISAAWRAAGLGRQLRRSADPLGQLEAGHRRTARLCDGAGARHRARMRPDRRRGRDQVPDDRNLARARRLEILGFVEFPRRCGASPPRSR